MLKVLIVEDEDIIRKGLIHTINWIDLDCNIIGAASNGAKGLEMIRQLRPDVVLTDIKMPYIDGLEMVEEASKEYFFKTILLTSYSEFVYAKKAIQLKVFDYLLKPLDERELREIINRINEEMETYYRYSKIVERTKQLPISEVENWDIQQEYGEMENPYVQRTIEIIQTSYNKKISIESIADTLGISSSYLSRKIKENLRKTYLEVLNKYRIQQSIQLLRKGTYKVYEVSEKCGFSDYKYFCNVFKKYTDMSPTQFMKSCGHVVEQSNSGEENKNGN